MNFVSPTNMSSAVTTHPILNQIIDKNTAVDVQKIEFGGESPVNQDSYGGSATVQVEQVSGVIGKSNQENVEVDIRSLGSLNQANLVASETGTNNKGLNKTRSVRSDQRSVKSIGKPGSMQSPKSVNSQKQETSQRDQLQFGNSQFEGSNIKLIPQEQTLRDDENYTPDFV